MPMGPAEIVASLKELCEGRPKIVTSEIVRWIEAQGGYESDIELITFAKKMKARQYARQLTFVDEESNRKVKRLFSRRESQHAERAYHDMLQCPKEQLAQYVQSYFQFIDQQRSLRRAMADCFAGQQFFEFFTDDDAEAAIAGVAEEE